MYKKRFLWAYYEFYDYIFGVCRELCGEADEAKNLTLRCLRRIYTEKGHATNEEISRFVNQMLIELTAQQCYASEREKEEKLKKYYI